MRALWSDRPNCSHNVSQELERIKCFSKYQKNTALTFSQSSQRKLFRKTRSDELFDLGVFYRVDFPPVIDNCSLTIFYRTLKSHQPLKKSVLAF